jgi:hypothetical protein
MTKYADLEIGLHRRQEHEYEVEFRYKPPDSAAESRPGGGLATINLAELGQLILDPGQYGQALAESLFADPNVLTPFAEARASAESLAVPLRVRLLIHPNAKELHRVRWETLRDPRDGSLLCADENLFLSRYTLTSDYRPVRLRLKSELRALVMAANPSNLAEYQLAPIDQSELNNARLLLNVVPAATLPEPGSDQRASLDNLIDQLRQNQYDIVYLLCHGSLDKEGESWLWLEGEDGRVARASGRELVERMKKLADSRPNLIVLASCQSAAESAADALTALGPRLAEAGVPAVIAMQGNITTDTVADFMPVFFKELQGDGTIDRAMAVARAKVQKHPDFWMPALFMRLEKGSIWSGFRDAEAFDKWPTLISLIQKERITPILGSGLVDPILGSLREIAREWAQEYGYPMYPHEHESLPQVTQYLSVVQYEAFPGERLEEYLRIEIQEKHRNDLPEKLLDPDASLDDLLSEIGANRRRRVPWDAYKVLASLDLPVYITSNLNYLLESALEEAGKKPRTVISPWNQYVVDSEAMYGFKEDYDPTPEAPLVYHLFGRLDDTDSVVLTEDDYFKYLIGVTKNTDLVPPTIQEALTNKALLFLGFRLEDWDFRVLFQSLLSYEGEALRKHRKKRFVHIAVQLEPEGIGDPEKACSYLKERFGEENINLYWGSTEDFIKELTFYLQANDGEGLT